MRKASWFGMMLVVFLLAATVWAGPVQVAAPVHLGEGKAIANPFPSNTLDEDQVIWSEDWESGMNGWEYYDALTQTDIYWAASDAAAHTGTYAWYCSDGAGGYGSHWLQWLVTPNLNLTTTTSPQLDFWFRLSCEGSDWDGAAVWVLYGDTEDNLTREVLTPTGTPYNNTNPINGFAGEFMLPYGDGWTGDFLDWSEAMVDLSSYTSNAVVKVAFVFASDGNTEPGFGFMVDDVTVMDGATEVFADGAEDAANSPMTMEAGNPVGPADQLSIGEPAGAPSPTHAMGSATTERGFYQFWESPTFDMPEAGDGESLWFNVQVNVEMENVDNRAVWYCQVYDPENDQWWYGSNIRGISGSNYIYVGGSNGWSDFTTDYGTDWDATLMAGVTGARIRLGLNMPPEVAPADFSFCWWDDVQLIKSTLEHDVGFTTTYIPFPRTVGQPVVGTTVMANLGPNAETVTQATWNFGAGARPFYPMGPYNLAVDQAMVLTLDAVPTDNMMGWVPGTAGAVTVSLSHNLSPDDIPDNNTMSGSVNVSAAGTWELGFDGSLLGSTSNQAYYAGTEGALMHVVPQAMGPSAAFAAHTLNALKYQLIWYDGWYGAGTTTEYELKVYAGGPTPGPVLWESDPIEFTDPSGTGGFATYWTTTDIPEADRPTFEAGEDYYLFFRPLTVAGAEGSPFEHIPFIRAQGNTHMHESDFSWRYDPDNGQYTGFQSTAWTLRAMVTPDMDGNMPPADFTLIFPGEVVQFPDVGFIWEPAMDPEHSPVMYSLHLFSGDNEVVFNNIPDNAFPVNLADTDLGAEPNQMYSWYVVAHDVFGNETESTDTFEFRMADLAPTPFALSAPRNGVEVSSTNPTFSWEGSHSPEGFDVTYTLHVESGTDEYVVDGLTGTSQAVDLEAELGAEPFQEYSWYVEAVDSEGRVRMSDATFDFTMYDTFVNEGQAMPTKFAVSDLYPNPFNPTTAMQVALPTAANVTLQVFDVLGRQVASIDYGTQTAGYHHMSWGDATQSSGLYIFVVKAGPLTVTRKAVFMK